MSSHLPLCQGGFFLVSVLSSFTKGQVVLLERSGGVFLLFVSVLLFKSEEFEFVFV